MDSTQENVVSVWLAADLPEAAFTALLAPREEALPENGMAPSAFADAFGIAWYELDFLEACFEEKNRPVAALLEGVSFGEGFVEAVAQLAAQAGLPEANAAALLYDTAYVLDPDVVTAAPMRFVGTFPFDPGPADAA